MAGFYSYVRGRKASRRRGERLLVALLVIAICASLTGPIGFAYAARAQENRHSAAEVSRVASELLFQESGVYGVVFMETNGTVLYKRNAELPFVAASLYKLIVMVDIFSRRERGEFSFDDLVELTYEHFPIFEDPEQLEDIYFPSWFIGASFSIGELMHAMIAYSSNVAARVLLSMTSVENLNWLAADLGMIGTHVLVPLADVSPWPPTSVTAENLRQSEEAVSFVNQWGEEGVINITTPADIATFLLQLANGDIISAGVSAEMEQLLAEQVINDRLPFFLPDGTRCPHKTGNLENVVHDAGIIYGNHGPTIMVALSEAVANDERATFVIQRLGLIAYGETDLPPIPASSPEAPSA